MAVANPSAAYVVGSIGLFRSNTATPEFNTRKKMKNMIKNAMLGVANVYFYDSLTHDPQINLRALKNNNAINFSWAKVADVGPVNWYTAPDISGYTPIPANRLVRRRDPRSYSRYLAPAAIRS